MSAATVTAYIGLGSNLAGKFGTPAEQIKTAIVQLDQMEQIRCAAQSSLYGSPPMRVQNQSVQDHCVQQPDYVNAVAEVVTHLSPNALLDALQHIEQLHERVREQRWGPRTLDMDILLYGDVEMNSERLQIPHPGLHQRAFVLVPLLEIAPQLVIPAHGKLSHMARSCPPQGLSLIGEIA